MKDDRICLFERIFPLITAEIASKHTLDIARRAGMESLRRKRMVCQPNYGGYLIWLQVSRNTSSTVSCSEKKHFQQDFRET